MAFLNGLLRRCYRRWRFQGSAAGMRRAGTLGSRGVGGDWALADARGGGAGRGGLVLGRARRGAVVVSAVGSVAS